MKYTIKKKSNKMEDLLLELENVLDRMANQGMQWGDILNQVRGHLEVHRPDAQEEYLDGSNPVFYYGPKESK